MSPSNNDGLAENLRGLALKLAAEADDSARDALRSLPTYSAPAAPQSAGSLLRDGAQTAVDSIGPVVRTLVREGLRHLGEQVEEFVRASREAVPPNWQHLTWPQIRRVGDLMVETGWSLAWAPPAKVIEAILAERSRSAQQALLLEVEGQISDELDRLLRGLEREEVRELRLAAGEALEAYRGGMFRASQALSAATISTVIHDVFGHRHARQAKRAIRKALPPNDATLRDFRLTVILGATAQVLEGYDASGRQRRPLFNRAETVHRVTPPQYSQANSLTALMLAVSLIQEVDGVLALIEREVAEEALTAGSSAASE